MKTRVNNLLLLITFVSFLTGCSSTPLQSTRLNKAETYMIQAEQALSSTQADRKNIAINNIGISQAYLATIKDNLKFLTKVEKKRYYALVTRAKGIEGRVRR